MIRLSELIQPVGKKSGRGAITLFVLGLAVAAVATWWLRTQGSASAGFVLICGPDTVPPPEFPNVLTTFAMEPIPLYLLIAASVGYMALFAKVRRSGYARLFPRRRAVSFLAGAAVTGLTVFGPFMAYDHTFLSVHMVQHFILITIAPPLLLAGGPLTLVLVSVSRRVRREWFYPVLHSRAFHAFTFPVVGLVLFGLIPTAYYVTPLFEASLENDLIHYTGFGVFLFAGIHYWWPIIPMNPTRWHLPFAAQLVYLLALVPIHAFLGLLFYEPSQILYPALAEAPRVWGWDPLFDQQVAGAFMFIAGEALGLAALMMVAFRWMKHEEAAGRRIDRELAKKRAAQAATTTTTKG
ncbi:MAG: cytochrome c oxidase assembly protein [Dehalococcoidia bacterium]|nr:cytochrome c oxidase assembly protein [Dehalococcoidia bacterium]